MRALLAAMLVSGLLLAGCSGTPSEDTDDPSASSSPAGSSSAASSQPATGSAPNGPPPQLSVGDFWEFESSAEGVQATTRIEVAALEDHDGVPAYRLEMTIETMAEGTAQDIESTVWIRQSDHAEIEDESRASFSFGGQSYDSTTTTVYDPPCVDLRWPLAVGATWSETCTSTTTTDGGSDTNTTTTTYTVEVKESITVEAGTFESFRLRIEDGDQTVKMWVSEEACGMVKFDATEEGQTINTELVDYEC